MKEKFEMYYSSKYPKIFQEGLENEAQMFWDEIEIDIKEVISPKHINLDKFGLLAKKINRFIVNYLPSPQRKEMLLTLFIKTLIEVNLPLQAKLVLMTLISSAFTKMNVKLKIKWQSIYEYLNNNLFRLSINHSFAHGGFSDKSWSYFSSFAKKMRKFYPEEANRDVLKLFRQFYSPLFVNVSKAGCYLYIFFRVSKSFPSKSYSDLLPELFELMSWKNHSWWLKIFLHIIVKIAWNHKDVDWEPYYDQLFSSFFLLIKNEFPKKVRTHVEQNMDYFYKFSNFFPRDYNNTVANLIAHLIRPENHPSSKRCWEYFERIYQATISFIHPENSGQWTRTLSSFYSHFARAYITRCFAEKQKREKFNKKQLAKTEKGDVENKGTDSQIPTEAFPEEAVEPNDADAENAEEGGDGGDDDDNESQAPEDESDFSSHLDDYCHTKFINYMIPVVKNAIFSPDRTVTDNGSSLMRSLLYFDAEKIAPIFLNLLYDIFDRTDFKHAGILSLVYGVAYPLFKRSIYYPGIYELPKLLDLTLNHLVAHDMIKTNLLLWFYQAVFSIIPIFTHDDLRNKCKEIYGEVDDKFIKDKLNENEKYDMWKLTEDISTWAVKFFTRFLDTFYYLQESTEHPQLKIKSVILVFKRFLSFIYQSSPQLRKQYISVLVKFMKNTDMKIANNYLSCIVISLNLAEPVTLLKEMIPVMKERMLYKLKHPRTHEYEKHGLYNSILKHDLPEEFDNYELKVTNKENLVWILHILQGLVTLNSPEVLKYVSDVKLMIYHCLIHDENSVSKKALYVLHILILTVKAIYPTNIGSFNPVDYSPEEFLNFYKKAGELSAKDCVPEWHVPNQEENNFIKDCIEKLLMPCVNTISEKYLKEYNNEDTVPDQSTFNKITDNMLLNPPTLSASNKKDLIDILTFGAQMFLAVSQFIPIDTFANLGEMKKNFESKFVYKEYTDLRHSLLKFLTKFLKFSFDTGIISEEKIAKPLIEWIGFLFCIDDQSSYLQETFNFLKTFTYYKSDSKIEKFDSRLFRLMAINGELQNKLYSYPLGVYFTVEMKSLPYLLTALCFHSNRSMATKACDILEFNIKYNEKNDKKELILGLINYSNSYIKDRFKYIGDNLGELEKKQVISIGDFKILKSIKDTYVDSLVYAAQKLTPVILRIMPSNFEIIMEIVQNQMIVPKSSDSGTLERFESLLKSLDLTVYSAKPNKIDNPILEKCELFDEFVEKSSGAEVKILDQFYTLESIRPQIENCLSKLILRLGDEEIHWKIRTAEGILGLVFSKLIEPTHKLYDEFIITIVKQLESKHYYIRYMAILFLSWVIERKAKNQRKIKSTVFKSSEEFKNIKMTLDEAFERHFILSEDKEKYYFKDQNIGLIEDYSTIKTFNLHDQKFEFPKEVYDYLHQDGNINKIIERSLNDVQIKYDNQEGNIALDFKKIMQTLFNFSHKSNYISSGNGDFQFFQGYFYFTIFRYFDGPKLVETSLDNIDNLSNDFNSREKHAVTSHYLYGVLRAMIYWKDEDKKNLLPKVSKIFIKIVENVSHDIFKNYIAAFANFITKVDFRLINPILHYILADPFKVKSLNVQLKLFLIYECLIKYHGIETKKILDDLLTKLMDYKPKNIKQSKEIPAMLISFFKFSLLIPVNYKKLKEENIVENIDQLIAEKPDVYFVENNYLLFKIEPKIHAIFQNIIKCVQESQNPDERKIYLDFIFTSLLLFSSERVTTILYTYYEPFIKFLLELDVNTMSLANDTIEKLKNHISFLGKLMYPSNLLPRIEELIKQCLRNPKFRVRENALRFYHYFYYNHIFYIQDKSLSIFDELLVDENTIVRKRAFDVFTDFIKIQTKEEIQNILQKSQTLVQKEETISLGLFIMMALILGHSFENEVWTEDLIKILLKKHKINKMVREAFREFANKYWDSHKGHANINGISLSQEIYYELRELSSPYTYFA